MALVADRTLDTVAVKDIPGAEGAPVADVRSIRRSPTSLIAYLKDAKVSVSNDLEEVTCNACASTPCPHVAAAIVAWIRRRVPVSEPKKLGLVDRLLQGPGWKNSDDFVGDFLQGAQGELEVRPDGSIELRLVRGARRATLQVPLEEAPALLWNLPKGILRSEKSRAVRVSRRPLEPELRAEYDAQRRLVIRPVWGNGITPADGARWHFDGTQYQALSTAPRDLRAHFKGERIIEEDDIPKFIEGEFRALCSSPAFKPSQEVRETRVAAPPSLSAVRVKAGAGDWLELDPVYTAGEERVAMSEILAVQGRKKFIRKGNTWIPAEMPQKYAGPTKMKRADFVLRKPAIKVEGDLPEFDAKREDPLPKGLLTQLRPYQKAGYDWLRYLRRAGLHGCLADDMGLGKTHQTMAFLLSLYEEGCRRPSLVVAPTSVITPWVQKIKQFAPALRPYLHYGPDRKPEILRLPGQRVIVTTYSLLVRDLEVLQSIDWECVVLDEAQYIKTSSTSFARAAKRLTAQTRIALTGTPVENRLDELRSIFEFILPGYLGSEDRFRERFEVPIVRHSDREARDELKRMIAPFKLRRVKSEVLQDLPPKVEDVRMCDLSAHQSALYRAIVQKDGASLVDDLKDRSKRVDYISVFAALGKLKRVCDHPALVVKGQRAADLESGKFETFKELLEEAMGSGQKVVVFTQYLEMMDVIEDHLRACRIPFTEIRGDTRDRAEAMRRFTEDEACRVFVCSLMAGGVGIDLTSASVVIHYDRWWNAAREDQATDRVHRWGQKRGVQVFKLVTRGTLEEKIDRMIAAKGELMNSVVEIDAGTFKCFEREELIDLLTGALGAPEPEPELAAV